MFKWNSNFGLMFSWIWAGGNPAQLSVSGAIHITWRLATTESAVLNLWKYLSW